MENSASGAQECSVGSILSRTWSVLREKPWMFGGISFVSLLIPEIIGRLAGYAAESYGAGAVYVQSVTDICGVFSALVCTALFSGAITYAVFQIFMGERASMTESLKRSVSRFPALCVMLLVQTAAIMLPLIVLIAVLFFIPVPFRLLTATPFMILIAVIFTPIALGIFIIWFVSVPACVVERAGPLKSLGRSRFLTKGHRFGILGMLILLAVINGILGALNYFVSVKLLGGGVAGALFSVLVSTMPTAFIYVMYTVVYYSLRATKENLASASLADIFD